MRTRNIGNGLQWGAYLCVVLVFAALIVAVVAIEAMTAL
jgi:hypothetical protein